jgi:hypothetical protein
MKAVCVTFAWGKYKNWKILYNNCINSFKKWHPDIELKVIEEELTECTNYIGSMHRIKHVKMLFDEGYTKVIMIGLDTFTCARWDEIIEDTSTPLILTLGGPYCLDQDVKYRSIFLPYHNWYENTALNADLICYNSKWAVEEIEKVVVKSKRHDNYAIDYYSNEINPGVCKILNFPYMFSPFVYNCRASWPGVLGGSCIQDNGTLTWGIDGPVIGAFPPTMVWKPIGDKLYNHIGKHIKAFNFDKNMDNTKIPIYFNDETVKWMKEKCDIDLTLQNIESWTKDELVNRP